MNLTTTSTNSGTRTMTGTDILGTAVALRGTQMGTSGRLEGAGALASWMLLSGNEDALDPIVEAIHKLVDEIAEDGHADTSLHELTLEMVLMALGDALLGGPLSAALGLPREAGRQIAGRKLAAAFNEMQAQLKPST